MKNDVLKLFDLLSLLITFPNRFYCALDILRKEDPGLLAFSMPAT
jgi:hypothetical protein